MSPDSGSPSDDTHTYTCDFASDLVSNMRMNSETLLDKHPNGIWCSELPGLYKVMTNSTDRILLKLKCECNVLNLIIINFSVNKDGSYSTNENRVEN